VTDVTPEPTHTATQPTGAPSAVPKEPEPRISTVDGVGAAAPGRGTDPVPTALSVDNSTTREPHPVVGGEDTVVVVVVVVVVVGVVGVVGVAVVTVVVGVPVVVVVVVVVARGTEAPPALAVPLPVVPPCAGGVTGGTEHGAELVQFSMGMVSVS
jgi:hypothetical protein